MKNLFQVAATIEKIETRKDHTAKIIIGTQELSPEAYSKLFELHQKTGWLLFKENSVSEEEIPEEEAPIDDNEKSTSQRLYNVLYVWYSQKKEAGRITKSFNEFRREYMEAKIQTIKDNLE